MGLHDVDKSGEQRTNPTVNAVDSSALVNAHATNGIAYRSEGGVGAPRVITKDDQIIVHDGTSNKALLGRDDSGNYVVKVAKDGADVLTATGDDLIFNSDNNLFKIITTGVIPISHVHTVNSAKTTSIGHGQTGRPTVICFATNLVAPGIASSAPSYQMPVTAPGVSGGNLVIAMLLQAYVDDTNLNIYTWSNPATTITADVRYYIIQETASST